jgi:hypothetical protein
LRKANATKEMNVYLATKAQSKLETNLSKGSRDLMAKGERIVTKLQETFNRKDVAMDRVKADFHRKDRS